MSRQEFRIYRPNNKKTGSASAFQFSEKKKEYTNKKEERVEWTDTMLFWTLAQQTGEDESGNASFGWQDTNRRIVVKLEEGDIGDILAVIRGFKAKAGNDGKGLFHKNQSGNAVINFNSQEDGSFFVKVSSKKDGAGEALAIGHPVSVADAMVLESLLRQFLVTKYGW